MNNLDADLQQAVKSIVETAKSLRSDDAQLRIEIAQVTREVGIERGITRDMIEAVNKRMDAYETKLERAVVALERLAARG